MRRAADATGDSLASTIAELVEAAGPMLDRVADLAEALKSAPEEVRATFAGAAVQLEELYGGVLEQADAFWKALESASRGEGPHPVTRGPES